MSFLQQSGKPRVIKVTVNETSLANHACTDRGILIGPVARIPIDTVAVQPTRVRNALFVISKLSPTTGQACVLQVSEDPYTHSWKKPTPAILEFTGAKIRDDEKGSKN